MVTDSFLKCICKFCLVCPLPVFTSTDIDLQICITFMIFILRTFCLPKVCLHDIDKNPFSVNHRFSVWKCSQITFQEASDCGLAAGRSRCGGTLGDRSFALFLPEEFHKPSCKNGSHTHVRKAVVKIEM